MAVQFAVRLGKLGMGVGIGWLPLAMFVCSCALPGIMRGSPDAGSSGEPRDVQRQVEAEVTADAGAASVDDSDAGTMSEPYDPKWDPANRNESVEEFEAMLSRDHVFAQWPMPDKVPGAHTTPSYTATDKVITDTVTRLRWQRELPKLYDGCTARYKLRDVPQEFGTGCTWEQAKAYCARPEIAQELGGGTWRLPTKIELESLLDHTRVPANDALFDTYPTDYFWSSSPFLNPEGLKLAWAVDFSDGFSFDGARFSGGRVRCVSSDDSSGGREPDFQVIDAVIVDRNTQLMWQRKHDSELHTWGEAKEYCASLSLSGGRWRLPTVKELLTLVDPTRRRPATYVRLFAETPDAMFWTSTEFIDAHETAYVVNFERGTALPLGMFSDKHYVRCVR